MTLQEHLAEGYRYEMRRQPPDPAPACALDIPRAERAAEVTRLQPMVDRRDHLSTIWQRFLKRCLDGHLES